MAEAEGLSIDDSRGGGGQAVDRLKAHRMGRAEGDAQVRGSTPGHAMQMERKRVGRGGNHRTLGPGDSR